MSWEQSLVLYLNYLSSAYLALVEKLEWRVDLTQVSQFFLIAPHLSMHLNAYQHTIFVGIRGWFDPLFRELWLTTYILVVSLGPPNVVVTGSPCIWGWHTNGERECGWEWTNWLCFTLQKSRVFILEREWTTRAPTSFAETFASLWKRVNSRLSVCLCERGARIHASPRLAQYAFCRLTGNAGASDLVGMPAKHNLGSLQ